MATRMMTLGGGSVLQRQLERERLQMDQQLQSQSRTQGRGIYAREVPASMRNHPLVRVLDQVDAGVRRQQVMHDENGRHIAAWQQLPAGSAQWAREAQRLLPLVQQEVTALTGIIGLVEEALRISQRDSRMAGTASTVVELHQQVSQWITDAQADMRGLREAISLGVTQATPPMVQQQPTASSGADPLLDEIFVALARVGQDREAYASDFQAMSRLPPGNSERVSVALSLLVQLSSERDEQQSLAQRIGLALDAAGRTTGAGAQGRTQALREAQSVVAQWGASLTTELAQVEAAAAGN